MNFNVTFSISTQLNEGPKTESQNYDGILRPHKEVKIQKKVLNLSVTFDYRYSKIHLSPSITYQHNIVFKNPTTGSSFKEVKLKLSHLQL